MSGKADRNILELSEPRLRLQSKSRGEKRVVAERWMAVQRKMRCVETDRTGEDITQNFESGSSDRHQTVPKGAVMHDQEIGPDFFRTLYRSPGKIHGSCQLHDLRLRSDLKPVHRIGIIRDLGGLEERVGEGC